MTLRPATSPPIAAADAAVQVPGDLDVRVLALVAAGEPPASGKDLKKVFPGRDGCLELVKWRGKYLQFYVRMIGGKRHVIGPNLPATSKSGCPLAWYARFQTAEALFTASREIQENTDVEDRKERLPSRKLS